MTDAATDSIQKMKVAICYWGMSRSTRHVYQSHYDKLFNILSKNNIAFDTYMHSWETNQNMVWGTDVNIPHDMNEYKLLNPTEYKLENQDDFLSTIHFDDYFDQKMYDTYGDSPEYEWRPYLVRNHICALESQKRVTAMCIASNKPYDFVIYVRPDARFFEEFPCKILQTIGQNEIGIPDFKQCEGYNDRCAVVPFFSCRHYAYRIDELKEFRRTQGRIVSEKVAKYSIDRHFTKVHFFPFYFHLVRPDGNETVH